MLPMFVRLDSDLSLWNKNFLLPTIRRPHKCDLLIVGRRKLQQCHSYADINLICCYRYWPQQNWAKSMCLKEFKLSNFKESKQANKQNKPHRNLERFKLGEAMYSSKNLSPTIKQRKTDVASKFLRLTANVIEEKSKNIGRVKTKIRSNIKWIQHNIS